MLSAADIRNAKFSKVRGGYKETDVDVFLDQVESDYAKFDRIVKEHQMQIDALNKEIDGLKISQNSLQNVLISAQKLADQIVEEAKAKSEEIVSNAESSISIITAKEKELSTTFELKAQERKNKLEKELADMVKAARTKADSINAAAEDSVSRQQILFDKLKMEVAAFKSSISAKYKDHLSMLQSLPDSVPMDPKHLAEIVAVAIDKAPNPESFIKSDSSADNKTIESHTQKDESVKESQEDKSEQGFKIATDAIIPDEDEF